MNARIFITMLLAGGLALMPSPLRADDGDIMAWPGVTGEWGGGRQSLPARGITLEMVYTGEFVRNFDPGLVSGSRETIYQDNLDLTVTVDSEKAGLWSGGTLFIYGLRNHGGDPSGNVIGDLQTASNIEAPDNFLVHEAWYEQQFADNFFSLLAGLYDLNSEFMVSDYGGLFLNSSFGIGPDVAANVATSLFPKAGLAVRARIQLLDGWYLQAVGLDGDPQTRSLHATEGKMFVVESGLSAGSGSYKVGYWLHTADKVYNGRTFNDDYGIYGIVDQELIALSGGGGIGAFLQLGWTPHNRNDVTHYAGAGLHVDGLIPGRDQDELGIALARAYTHAAIENAVELTWRLVITPWLALQPSMQWIINPGGVVAAPTIKTGLLRFEVTI